MIADVGRGSIAGVTQRVLVTGAGGYLGRAVVTALLDAGHTPIAFVRNPSPRAGAFARPSTTERRSGWLADVPRRPADLAVPGVEVRRGDLLDGSSLAAAVRDVDAVCHLAGLARVRESLDQPLRYFRVNLTGTVNLLSAAEDADVRHVVFASTASIYGVPPRQPMSEDLPDDPRNPYAASKLAAESVITWQARTGRLAATVLRLFNAAGPLDPEPTRIIPRVLAVAAGRSAELEVNGDGRVVRDYLHVADAAEAFVAAVDRPPPVGRVSRYNIGSGIGSSVLDVIATAERVTGRRIPVVRRPAAAEAPVLICDPTRAITDLGWKPHRSQLDSIIRAAYHPTCRHLPPLPAATDRLAETLAETATCGACRPRMPGRCHVRTLPTRNARRTPTDADGRQHQRTLPTRNARRTPTDADGRQHQRTLPTRGCRGVVMCGRSLTGGRAGWDGFGQAARATGPWKV